MENYHDLFSLSSNSDIPESLKEKIFTEEEFDPVVTNLDCMEVQKEPERDLPYANCYERKKFLPLTSNMEKILEESQQDPSD